MCIIRLFFTEQFQPDELRSSSMEESEEAAGRHDSSVLIIHTQLLSFLICVTVTP